MRGPIEFSLFVREGFGVFLINFCLVFRFHTDRTLSGKGLEKKRKKKTETAHFFTKKINKEKADTPVLRFFWLSNHGVDTFIGFFHTEGGRAVCWYIGAGVWIGRDLSPGRGTLPLGWYNDEFFTLKSTPHVAALVCICKDSLD